MNRNSATLQREASSDQTSVPTMTRSLLGKYARQFDSSPVSFKVILPDGSVQLFGKDEPRFEVTLNNAKALRAVSSMDEGRFADIYVAGDIDIDGDMLAPYALRGSMKDFHPLTTTWRFLQPLLFGQVRTNKQAITGHYEMDPDFFLGFLDPKTPCYTQGMRTRRRTSRSTWRRLGSSTTALRNAV